MPVPFQNEPFTDFGAEGNQTLFKNALRLVESELGKHYPLIIGGKEMETKTKAISINPSQKDQVIGSLSQAGEEQAEQAIVTAQAVFEHWRYTTFTERARYLFKAATLLRRRKHEFSAWMVYEAGKTWGEADADTAEAIDFMEFYAREAQRLAQPQPLVHIEGEDNELYYVPLGVGVIIPPWNFPLAIMAGMTTAAIVSGNTVVLKPASTTSVIAAKFVQLLIEAGVPSGVVNFIPGAGSEIGDYLVDHPLTRFISFTGSREVGLRINERAAKTAPGQRWMKRVIAEMGGKDAIIVDEGSDLTAAAEAITASAFGFAGQKCSACSRAIIHESVYDEVLSKVIELTRKLKVGSPLQPETNVGPVIDPHAFRKIQDYIKIGRTEGEIVLGGKAEINDGYFIEPTIIAGVSPTSRVSQEEIFGPVVAFTKASSFSEALRYANNTEFGLTGAVFSRNRTHLEQARSVFFAGNLYFNRKCTGALVGVHPFGGFNMSGTDSKAGGRDYLLLFTQAKLVSEKY